MVRRELVTADANGVFLSDDISHIYKTVTSHKKLTRRVIKNFFLDPRTVKRCEGLIPDLDAYFYLVGSHSRGVDFVVKWQVSETVVSQSLLKKSFFQTYTRHREIE